MIDRPIISDAMLARGWGRQPFRGLLEYLDATPVGRGILWQLERAEQTRYFIEQTERLKLLPPEPERIPSRFPSPPAKQ